MCLNGTHLYTSTSCASFHNSLLYIQKFIQIYSKILFCKSLLLLSGLVTGFSSQDRSVVIATYALCGFSNLASMGVQLGGLGALAPSRKSDMSKIVVRAMIAGNVACFMTACIAGKMAAVELHEYVIKLRC